MSLDCKYYNFVLTNGLKVLLVPRASDGLVHVAVDMINGNILESKGQYSFTHVGEHLLAMFTSSRNPDFHKITHRLGQVGAETNAYTSTFSSGYWLQGQSKYLPWFLQLMSDMFFHYEFHDDWEKQKNIVLEEIKMRSTYAWVNMDEAEDRILFGNHRLGASWQDELKSVQDATLNDVLTFSKNLLDPRRALLSIEGDFDMNSIKNSIEQLFNSRSDIKHVFKVDPVPPLSEPVKKQMTLPNINTGRITWLFQNNINLFDKLKVTKVISFLRYFSSGYFSRLYQLLREKEGLVYGVSDDMFFSPVPEIPSHVKFIINVDPKNIKKVIRLLFAEIEHVKSELIPHDDFTRIQNVNQVTRASETLNNRLGKFIDWYGPNFMWDSEIISFQEYFDMMQRITPEDIREIARDILNVNHSCLLVAKPQLTNNQ